MGIDNFLFVLEMYFVLENNVTHILKSINYISKKYFFILKKISLDSMDNLSTYKVNIDRNGNLYIENGFDLFILKMISSQHIINFKTTKKEKNS